MRITQKYLPMSYTQNDLRELRGIQSASQPSPLRAMATLPKYGKAPKHEQFVDDALCEGQRQVKPTTTAQLRSLNQHVKKVKAMPKPH